MYTCSSNSFELAAIMWYGCYCLNISQSVIHNVIQDNYRCALEGDHSLGTYYWAFHYDVTGSCEHPGDVANGSWSSTSTYLGSRLTLTCQPGYVINGSKSIDCKPNDDAHKSDWDKKIPHCQSLPRTTLQPPASEVHVRKGRSVFVPTLVISVVLVVLLVSILMSCRYSKEKRCRTACRRNEDDINQVESSVASPSPEVSQVIHTYADMSDIPTRETDGPNASRLPSASLSLSSVSSNLRQTARMMPTTAVVTDTDVDDYGYTLPGSESMMTSASASMVDRCPIDDDIDEYGYQIPRKREESYYTELI
ncbi:uncharacterized protein LOC105446782 [Strongylocentrotus purpuratus]|uniref:Sushi domain-containing protein n=1 Tax=Strongylocentrotus purpuratus TaxID=7668 RepID=A0A7M7NI96_STRPU|nr:uncharacterized protein LOC105446782 [Strongylocentrotus purpuratus]